MRNQHNARVQFHDHSRDPDDYRVNWLLHSVMNVENSVNSVDTLMTSVMGNTEPSRRRYRGRCNDHPYMGVGRKARPKRRAPVKAMIWSVLHGNMQQSKDVCGAAIRREHKDGNSVPYSGKLEALSKFDVRKPVMQALRNDAAKTLDRAAYAQFYLTPLRVVPTGGTDTTLLTLTTNGTATLTNQVALGTGHVKTIVDTMKERNIPAYSGDDYIALAWPTTFRGVKNTLETLHQYTESGIKLIFNGEIGRYENMRFVEQTNVTKGITATGAGGVAWTGGDSDWAFFFGEDTVAEGIAVPEEVRAKVPTDYGRSKGVAWYALLGYGIVHTNATQARIVMWDTAV